MKIDRVVLAMLVSWVGLWVHELHRLATLLGFTPDGDLFMLAMAAGLAFWWSRLRGPRLPARSRHMPRSTWSAGS
ncbi:MAG TPA: hypothetical protein VGS16_05895 [Candidatus Dormibacteraeota bacterium]|nr:hypothetical protein [Candidatus Dormibacteraeota bacterium]